MELGYLFGLPFTGMNTEDGGPIQKPYSDVDRQLSIRMMMLWTNYAKYGYVFNVSASSVAMVAPLTTRRASTMGVSKR